MNVSNMKQSNLWIRLNSIKFKVFQFKFFKMKEKLLWLYYWVVIWVCKSITLSKKSFNASKKSVKNNKKRKNIELLNMFHHQYDFLMNLLLFSMQSINQLRYLINPSKHTTSFWRLYNVHNVKTTSYERKNNVVCVLGFLIPWWSYRWWCALGRCKHYSPQGPKAYSSSPNAKRKVFLL